MPEGFYVSKQERANLKFHHVTFFGHGIGGKTHLDHGGMCRVSIYMQETILNTADFNYLLSVTC